MLSGGAARRNAGGKLHDLDCAVLNWLLADLAAAAARSQVRRVRS
jgi:hypothetical protein